MKHLLSKIKRMDKYLLFFTFLLVAIGLVMIFSASNVTALLRYGESPWNYFIKQSIWLVLSLIIFFFIILVNKKTFKRLAYLSFLVVVGALIVVLIKEQYINNTRGWLLLFKGKVGIQPSEFFKLIYIVIASIYYDKYKDNLDEIKYLLFPLGIGILGFILVFLQPDVGTSLILLFLIGFLFLINPVAKPLKKKLKLPVVLMILIFIVALFNKSSLITKIPEDKRNRFNLHGFCSSERFYTDGNQLCNSLIAFNNGGLTGKGLSNSSQKYLYLAESHTDFIFPVIVEELGLIGGLIILFIFFLCFWRIIYIGRRAYHNYQASIAYGVFAMMALHLFVNIGGASALIPLTGIPIPFLSYGGSSLIVNMAAIAIVQRVAIDTNLRKIPGRKKIN